MITLGVISGRLIKIPFNLNLNEKVRRVFRGLKISLSWVENILYTHMIHIESRHHTKPQMMPVSRSVNMLPQQRTTRCFGPKMETIPKDVDNRGCLDLRSLKYSTLCLHMNSLISLHKQHATFSYVISTESHRLQCREWQRVVTK